MVNRHQSLFQLAALNVLAVMGPLTAVPSRLQIVDVGQRGAIRIAAWDAVIHAAQHAVIHVVQPAVRPLDLLVSINAVLVPAHAVLTASDVAASADFYIPSQKIFGLLIIHWWTSTNFG